MLSNSKINQFDDTNNFIIGSNHNQFYRQHPQTNQNHPVDMSQNNQIQFNNGTVSSIFGSNNLIKNNGQQIMRLNGNPAGNTTQHSNKQSQKQMKVFNQIKNKSRKKREPSKEQVIINYSDIHCKYTTFLFWFSQKGISEQLIKLFF